MDELVNGRVEEMDLQGLENELRAHLQHVPAPQGFTDRVMERVAQREAAREQRAQPKRGFTVAVRRLERHAAVWTSIAAMLLLSAGGGVLYTRHEREEARAAEVQRQMDLAMELTGHALEQVQGGLDRSTAGQFLNEIK